MNIFDSTLRMINEHGVALSLVRKTGGDVDPVTSIRADDSETSFTIHGVEITSTVEMTKEFGDAVATDAVFITDTSVEPEIGDKYTVNNKTLTLKEYKTQYFENKVLIYTIRLVS